MVCARGGGGRSSRLKEGGGDWERGSRDRPIAEPLFGVPFYPILGPRDGRGYVATWPTCGPPRGQGLCPHCPNFSHQLSLCHGMWSGMTGHKYHRRWGAVGGLRYGPRHGSPEVGGGLRKGLQRPPRAQTFFLPPLQAFA